MLIELNVDSLPHLQIFDNKHVIRLLPLPVVSCDSSHPFLLNHLFSSYHNPHFNLYEECISF